MNLANYLSDPDVVVRLKGVIITDLELFKAMADNHQTFLNVDNEIAIGGKSYRAVPLEANGDFDMGSNLAVQTYRGLLTVASKPGRRSRLIGASRPREPQPEEYQHPMRHYAGDQGRFNNRRY